MTTSNISVSEDEFREILERVRRFLERVEQVANELIRNVYHVIDFLPDDFADLIVDILNRFGGLVGQFPQRSRRVPPATGLAPRALFSRR